MKEQATYKHILTEDSFNNLLPNDLKSIAHLFFTPIEVAELATNWLTENKEQKILDLGAGLGKFCISGARISTSNFYGVEHRKSLITIGENLIEHFETTNVTMIHKNILEVDFSKYEAFYFFNSFYENLEAEQRLNDEVTLEEELYQTYLEYTESQLDNLKIGTRLVTYYGNNFEVPNSYQKVRDAFDGALKLWIKME